MKWIIVLMLVSAAADAGAFSFLTDSFKFISSMLPEVCPVLNAARLSRLEDELKNNLFGQHLVTEKLYPLLQDHFLGKSRKALVISMHGWTGSGKTFVSNIIANSLYHQGSKSRFVHFFNGRLNFPLASKAAVEQYSMELQNWVMGNISLCPNSMFVFDEADKMPPGITDALKPFLDFTPIVNGVHVKNAIFLFMSNFGGKQIVEKYLDLWNSGVPRDEMSYFQFEPILRNLMYNSAGGFERTSLISHHLISLYLPFLPLERRHVVQCIETEMKHRGFPILEQEVGYVLDELEFYKGLLSVNGCKRVSDLVAMFMYGKKYEL